MLSMAALAIPLWFATTSAFAAQNAPDGNVITVYGNKRSITETIKGAVAESRFGQIARFEKKLCPFVIGLPSGLNEKVMRIVRANILSLGGKVEEPGCEINTLALFVDRPRDLLVALNAKEPSFFEMSPRAFDNLVSRDRPYYAWTMSDTFGPRGQALRRIGAIIYYPMGDTKSGIRVPIAGGNGVIAKNVNESRLSTGTRQEIELSMLAIDLDESEGRTLRQLADFITMHFMLELKPTAGEEDRSSILSLFQPRNESVPVPASMSMLDRGIISGLYVQRHNNRSATQQRENIASAIRKESRKASRGE